MKVKELKELLSKVSDDADVSFQMRSGCCGDVEYMEVAYTDDYEPSKSIPEGHVSITFESLPGYKSCIQAGGTIRADKEYWEKHGKKETP